MCCLFFFFFQAEDGIRDYKVTGVQTCALPISYCATCDGALPLFRNQPLVVVGGGDSACEEALYLTRFGSAVHMVHRREALRASKIMAERALSHAKIKPIWDSVVTEVLDVNQDKVTGVRLRNQIGRAHV